MKRLILALIILMACTGQAWGANYIVRTGGGAIYSLTGAAESSGLIQLTRISHTFVTGDTLTIYGIVGTNGLDTASRGTWTITKNGTNTFTLDGSTWPAGAEYTSGGKAVYSGSDPTSTKKSLSPANFNLFSPYLLAGDTVYLSSLGGDITTALSVTTASGSGSGSPITIKPYTGDTGVVITVSAGAGAIEIIGTSSYFHILGPMTLTNTSQTGLKLVDVSNSLVSGITATGNKSYGILIQGGSNNHVEDSRVTSTTDYSGIGVMGSAAVNADNNTIEGNTCIANGDAGIRVSESSPTTVFAAANLDGNKVFDNNCTGNGSGVYVKLALNTLVFSNICASNTLAGHEGYGIANQSSPGSRIYLNTVSSNGTHGIENWGSHRPTPTEYGESNDVRIYRNYVHGHHYGDSLTGTGIKARKDWVTDTLVWSNIVYDNDQGLGVGDNSTGVKWYGNTVSGNVYGVYVWEATGGGTSGAGTSLANNIVTGNVVNAMVTKTGVTAGLEAHNNNLYYYAPTHGLISYNGSIYGSDNATSWESSAVLSNPLLAADYSIPRSSPAIDSGVNLGSTYATDYAGRDQRRFGRGWEIGAYAFPNAAMPGGM